MNQKVYKNCPLCHNDFIHKSKYDLNCNKCFYNLEVLNDYIIYDCFIIRRYEIDRYFNYEQTVIYYMNKSIYFYNHIVDIKDLPLTFNQLETIRIFK